MVDGIQGGDPVNLARQLGVVTAHTNNGVGQEFAALSTQALAVIAALGILRKVISGKG